MNWSDEPYCKLYTNDSRNWKRMGWQARCVLVMLMRRVDRAGVREYGPGWDLAEVADDLGLPEEIVKDGLEKLMATGTVTICDTSSRGLVIPNFMFANESIQSDKARQRKVREGRRILAVFGERQATESSQDVTKRDAPSRDLEVSDQKSLSLSDSLTSKSPEMSKECARCGKKTQPLLLDQDKWLCIGCRFAHQSINRRKRE